jgi:multidrug resistance efflux pump
MSRKYVLPLLAAAALALAVFHVVRAQQPGAPVTPPLPPARTPFRHALAGAGTVEAQTENIAVGAPLAGVVAEVFAQPGQRVRAGTPLFRLDDRQLQAELKVRETALAVAEAQHSRQEQLPRAEELPPRAARVREAQANLLAQEDQLKRARESAHRQAVAVEELVRREQSVQMAREQLAQAQAEHDLLKAGAWEADKAISYASVLQARAQLEQTRAELDRLVVRALVEGEVLQVNVRPGEFVGAPPGQALVVFGDVRKLHVRVDIDEHDIPRFRPGAPARAMLRGNPGQELSLTFVRVEPYVVAKRALTGGQRERVDTRVLQAVYALDPCPTPVYVGQQLDVFIAAETPTGAE